MRIERFVETNNLLSYEQAGFRKREECVGQVVSLVDIIQRRQNAGLNTHVLFIDIRKAFDTVPVGALLWKLQNMGFPRRTLSFLKALYTSSSARARAGSLLSDPFPVQRGVRQGCPLSGLLFNLFINDILDGVAPITVPGLPRDTSPIRGLMYADDVAVFADSEQSLLAASTAIEQWADQWEMQFGVAKCGIISFTGHLAPRLDNPLDIRLHGQLVSRVESYKYLGVLIDSKLDHSAWLKQKRSALEHTISALHPVLANHQLTVNYRSRIFSAVVMGKAYYGLELVGGNKSHLAPLQTTINKGIRLFTGARLSTAIGPLLVETGIGSLLTRSLVSREQILADTTGQTKDSQATAFVCIDGDSANMWRLCIAPKSGLVPAIQKSRLRLLGRALDPGVENVYTWLRGGVLNGEADLDQQWLDGTVEHESMGTRHDNRALAARLADFLQVAYRQYQSTLWKYTTGIASWKLANLLPAPTSLCLNGQQNTLDEILYGCSYSLATPSNASNSGVTGITGMTGMTGMTELREPQTPEWTRLFLEKTAVNSRSLAAVDSNIRNLLEDIRLPWTPILENMSVVYPKHVRTLPPCSLNGPLHVLVINPANTDHMLRFSIGLSAAQCISVEAFSLSLVKVVTDISEYTHIDDVFNSILFYLWSNSCFG
ncbi:hypothetical protein BASA83_009709 [Batrachochytrium salamandrivorans]|nr:hypothetical protein BASA83_009709 [Batrachochytrium salamandrivorans]